MKQHKEEGALCELHQPDIPQTHPKALPNRAGGHIGVGCAVTPRTERMEGDASVRLPTDVQEGVFGAKLRFRGSPEPANLFSVSLPSKTPLSVLPPSQQPCARLPLPKAILGQKEVQKRRWET